MLCKTWKDDFDVYKLCMMCMKDFAMTLVLWFSSSLQAVKVAIFFVLLFSDSHIWWSRKESLLEAVQYCNNVQDSSHM